MNNRLVVLNKNDFFQEIGEVEKFGIIEEEEKGNKLLRCNIGKFDSLSPSSRRFGGFSASRNKKIKNKPVKENRYERPRTKYC